MPSTIPFDPSLVLGNIVPQAIMDNVLAIGKAQAPADAAEQEMNSLNSLKKSIDMTIQEMMGMGISTTDLITETNTVGKELAKSAVAFAKAKIHSQKAIQPLRAKLIGVSEQVESPIDYNRSQLKQMPLSADSLKMDCQYFSYDQNSQSSNSHAATVASFVSDSVDIFGEKASYDAHASAQNQVNSQHANHSIAGTLVVSITCTHKNAQVFAPYFLDVDKAVMSWNALFPNDMIDTSSPISIAKIENDAGTKKDKSFNILSGATYGSSFIAMVHILNKTTSESSQSMESVAASLTESFEVGSWFADESGGFGVSSTFSNSAKNILSTQFVQSHCSLITMGIIPSIKSNQVAMAVQGFADFDPAKSMESLAALQNATSSQNSTVASAATAARTGQQMISLENAKISATLSSVAEIDDGQNKIIDTNSVMTALDDYVERCVSGGDNLGVPINYFLKPISQSEIARAWTAKYFPNKFNKAGSADDSSQDTDTGESS